VTGVVLAQGARGMLLRVQGGIPRQFGRASPDARERIPTNVVDFYSQPGIVRPSSQKIYVSASQFERRQHHCRETKCS
jgi:hypothetical protein